MQSLLKHMEKEALSVEWTVLSDIGPDWIGSSRSICYYLENTALSETSFHDQLKDTLIKAVNIPDESEESVIYGEGDIIISGNFLQINYWWTKTIPYAEKPNDRGKGEINLIRIE